VIASHRDPSTTRCGYQLGGIIDCLRPVRTTRKRTARRSATAVHHRTLFAEGDGDPAACSARCSGNERDSTI
jgi:hypothetical protein